MTAVAGASRVYRGGLITYATDLKSTLAGVPANLLDRDGPVAAATAAAMAQGAARTCGADWGLAVTGVAGPDPQAGHPVGQVYVGVVGPGAEPAVHEFALTGDRAQVRERTVERALAVLVDALGGI